MKFLNPVFLPTLFILTVAATPPSFFYLRRCATTDSVWVGAAKKETRVRPAQALR